MDRALMDEAHTDNIWRVGNELVQQLSKGQRAELVWVLCTLQPQHAPIFRGMPTKTLGEVARSILWSNDELREKAFSGDLPSGDELLPLMKEQITN
jgi:hypothetical protein